MWIRAPSTPWQKRYPGGGGEGGGQKRKERKTPLSKNRIFINIRIFELIRLGKAYLLFPRVCCRISERFSVLVCRHIVHTKQNSATLSQILIKTFNKQMDSHLGTGGQKASFWNEILFSPSSFLFPSDHRRISFPPSICMQLPPSLPFLPVLTMATRR